MRLISINVGLPREVLWHREWVQTSIWKTPVEGQVRVDALNLAGDQQSDLSVHGGRDKSVYLYPSEHYAFWRSALPGVDLPWGVFGENFTTEGLLEHEVRIGDRLRIGTAEFRVTQPRMPCFKLGIRFGRPDMVKRFLKSERTGFYLTVLRQGHVCAGDAIQHVPVVDGVTVRDLIAVYTADSPDQTLLRRAVDAPFLSDAWRTDLRKRLSDGHPTRRPS